MIHQGSKETYDFIAQWCNTPFPFSKNDEWNRYALPSVLGHLFLLGLPDAHILEIGVGESSLYLSELARRLKRTVYLCDVAPSKIDNPLTVDGYLLQSGYFFYGESDLFFKNVEFLPIGIAFIDGDHNYEQVKKDFDNTWKILVENGVIFLHDTYPPDEAMTSEHRCGTVYKLRQELEKRDDLDCFTFTKIAGVDVGITMVRKKPLNRPFYQA